MLSTAAPDALALQTFSSGVDLQVRDARSSPTGRAELENVPTAAPEPSRTYKCLLVLAGFMMTFHVIGINSIYGLFQVRPDQRRTTFLRTY